MKDYNIYNCTKNWYTGKSANIKNEIWLIHLKYYNYNCTKTDIQEKVPILGSKYDVSIESTTNAIAVLRTEWNMIYPS